MNGLPPYDLVPLGEGRYELRAFSDDSDDPIKITLDADAGGALAIALGESLVSLDEPKPAEREFRVAVGQREIMVLALPGRGIRLTVTRGASERS